MWKKITEAVVCQPTLVCCCLFGDVFFESQAERLGSPETTPHTTAMFVAERQSNYSTLPRELANAYSVGFAQYWRFEAFRVLDRSGTGRLCGNLARPSYTTTFPRSSPTAKSKPNKPPKASTFALEKNHRPQRTKGRGGTVEAAFTNHGPA